MPRDDGNLILTRQESEELIRAFPLAKRFLRDFCGAQEFLKSSPRRCLWIVDEDLELAQAVPAISERIENVRRFRLASPAKTTRAYAKIPHKMAQRAHRPGTAILLPRHSSEQRSYIPLGFFDDSTVISDAALVLYDAPAFLFGILSSCMHMSWVRTVCGRIKTDYRYSAELCYNPFPLPTLSASQARAVEQAVYAVLDVREQYTERSLAQLYDTRSMPDNLKSAHRDLDSVVDAAYRSSPFRNDEDRIKYLFQIYRQNALGGSRA